MARTADQVVVRLGVQADGPAAHGPPEILHASRRLPAKIGARSDQADRVVKQVRPRRRHAGFFRSGHGMAADKFRPGLAHNRLQFLDHRALDAADIGDDRALLEKGAHLRRQRGHLGERRAKNDQLRPLHRFLEVLGDEVGNLQLPALGNGSVAPDASADPGGQWAAFEGQAQMILPAIPPR